MNGMNNMETNSQRSLEELSSDQVCSIIRVCGENEVSVLKFRGLYVQFGKQTTTSWPLSQVQNTQNKEQLASSEAITRDALEEEAVLTRSERLALLRIEDPLEYERLLMTGELESDTDGRIGDEETNDR